MPQGDSQRSSTSRSKRSIEMIGRGPDKKRDDERWISADCEAVNQNLNLLASHLIGSFFETEAKHLWRASAR